MIEREYLKLNTSVQTASNSSELLHDKEGNVLAAIELRLPDSLFQVNNGNKVIDHVEMQTSKMRLSLAETPIAELPLDMEKTESPDHIISTCQLDVYPYCLLDNDELRPDPANPNDPLAFPYYKAHDVTYKIRLYTSLSPEAYSDITEISGKANTSGYGFPKTSIYYPILEHNGVIKAVDHMMNLCAQTNHETPKIMNSSLLIKNIATLEQILQDAIENAITYASTEDHQFIIVNLIDKNIVTRDLTPQPNQDISVQIGGYTAVYWYWEHDEDNSTTVCHLKHACKPRVQLGAQSLTIAYDSAAFDPCIPVFRNSSYINTYDKPEQMTLDKLRNTAWTEPPPKRFYKYGVITDANTVYSYSLLASITCAPMNLIANEAMKNMFSFLPWIPFSLNDTPSVIPETNSTRRTRNTPQYLVRVSTTPRPPYIIPKYSGVTVCCNKFYISYYKFCKYEGSTGFDNTPNVLCYQFQVNKAAYDANPDDMTIRRAQNTVFGNVTYLSDTQSDSYRPFLINSGTANPFAQTISESYYTSEMPEIPPDVVEEKQVPTDLTNVTPAQTNMSNYLSYYIEDQTSHVWSWKQGLHKGNWVPAANRATQYIPPIPMTDVNVESYDDETYLVTGYWVQPASTPNNIPWIRYFASDSETGEIMNAYTNVEWIEPPLFYDTQYTSTTATFVTTADDVEFNTTIETTLETTLTTNSVKIIASRAEPFNINGTYCYPNGFHITWSSGSGIESDDVIALSFDCPDGVAPTIENRDKFKNQYIFFLDQASAETRPYRQQQERIERYVYENSRTTNVETTTTTSSYTYIPFGERPEVGTHDLPPYLLEHNVGGFKTLPTDAVDYSYPMLYNVNGVFTPGLNPYGEWRSPSYQAWLPPYAPDYTEGPNYGSYNHGNLTTEDANRPATPTGYTHYYLFWSIYRQGIDYSTDYLYYDCGNAEYSLNAELEVKYETTTNRAIVSIVPNPFDPDPTPTPPEPVITTTDALPNFELETAQTRFYILDGTSANVELSEQEVIDEREIDSRSLRGTNPNYRGNVRISFTWDNLPMVVLSPIASIVLTLQGMQINQEIQPINITQPTGSSLTATIPVIENYYSLAQTLRDLHDELVVVKDSFDDTATYTLPQYAGQERVLRLSAKYITKDGSLHDIYIPKNGVFSLQLTFGLSFYTT